MDDEVKLIELFVAVFILIFNCLLESKTGEASTHLIIPGWCENSHTGISYREI